MSLLWPCLVHVYIVVVVALTWCTEIDFRVCLCLSVCVCVCLCVCLCVAMHVWCGVEGRGVVSGAVQFHGIVILRYCYAAISLLPRFQCRDINIIAIFTNS